MPGTYSSRSHEIDHGCMSSDGLVQQRFRIDERRQIPLEFQRKLDAGSWRGRVVRAGGPEMPMSISMILLSSQLIVPIADGVPKFDIARSCKLDVAATAGLAVDQSIKSCMNDEQKAKRQLASQWSKFPAAGRASCTSEESIGGTPSYVSLLTCLQLGQ